MRDFLFLTKRAIQLQFEHTVGAMLFAGGYPKCVGFGGFPAIKHHIIIRLKVSWFSASLEPSKHPSAILSFSD